MRTVIPVFFLTLVLSMLFPRVQRTARAVLKRRPALVFAAPAGLSLVFLGLLGYYGALAWQMAALTIAYTFLPVTAVYRQGPDAARPSAVDLAAVLFLWLPVELTIGRDWIPPPIRGLAHQAIYGVAVTLALVLFLLYRGWGGMKYRWPAERRDWWLPLAGFVVVAPILMALGLALGFIKPFHIGAQVSAAWLATRFVLILAGVALPEEIMFRALIQNWVFQRFGESNRSLLAASIVFGAAHLNNAPGPPPNWRYLILATVAGFVYGKVFQKGSSVFASAFLHALVNTIRHGFF